MNEGGRAHTRILHVSSRDNADCVTRLLREKWGESSVEVATTQPEVAARVEESLDCILTDYTFDGGTWEDVLDIVEVAGSTIPVVVLVRVTDGSRLKHVMTGEADECLAIDSELPRDEIERSVGQYVPSPEGPEVADPYPADGQPVTEWKAHILDQLIANVPIHIYVKDREGRHVMVNEEHNDDPAEFLGKRDIDLGHVNEENARSAYEDDIRVVETAEPIIETEEFYPSVNVWNLTSKIPWYDTNDRITGVVGISQEITEQKTREQHLKVINRLLRHNLRNDLNVIQGYAEILEREVGMDHPGPDSIIGTVDGLLSTVDKQREIVETLTSGQEATPRDAIASIRTAIRTVEAESPDVCISTELPESLGVHATSDLDRAFLELLENAIEHNNRDVASIEISTERVDGDARIHITDDGPTIPDSEISVLTGTQELDPLCHGSGLGLWLVTWIVGQSDGTVSFETNDPRGNHVMIRLPLASDD